MVAFLKPIRLIFALITVIAVLIVIPAAQFGVAGNWRVIFYQSVILFSF
ncbi:hypothetical protein NIES25_39580 [Nostoc linckia NIES-25]|nr:hypothetical protein NIES25_39580 [Nostoc linckia NIES-25]